MSYWDTTSAYDSPTAVTSTSTYWSPVASGANLDETDTAVDLSTDEGVVATLGGTPGAPLTYNAAGLLNAMVDAGTGNSPVQNLESYVPSTSSYTNELPCDDDAGTSGTSSTGVPSPWQWASLYGTNSGADASGSGFYATA